MAFCLAGSKPWFLSVTFSQLKRNQTVTKTKDSITFQVVRVLLCFADQRDKWRGGRGCLSTSLLISPFSLNSAASISSITHRPSSRGLWIYTFWSVKRWARTWQNSLWHHEDGRLFYRGSRWSGSLSGRKGSLWTSNSSTETLNHVWICRCPKKICSLIFDF